MSVDYSKVRFGVQIRPGSLSDLVHQTVLCEKIGFDSVWWMDHLIGGAPTSTWPELYTAMTMMGLNTSRVAIGSAITDVLRRHPSIVAQSIASVDSATNGRAVLGLGAGEAMNLVPFGIPAEDLYGRLREGIQVIKMLWEADGTNRANFDGKFYQLKGAYMQSKPTRKPGPPIYVGAFGRKMMEMAGELADGWIPFGHTPETYRAALEGPVSLGLQRAGKPVSGFDAGLVPIATVSKSRDEARAVAEPIAKGVLAQLPPLVERLVPTLKHPGFDYTLAGFMGPVASAGDSQALTEFTKQIPSEVALKTVIWGTPDDCISQIDQFVKAGCKHFVFAVRGPNTEHVMKLFAVEVLPYFWNLRK